MVITNSLYNDVSKQGLGNNLFQYCWAREIAERKGYALFSNPIFGFPTTYTNINGIEKTENVYVTPQATQIFDMDGIYKHDGQICLLRLPNIYSYSAFCSQICNKTSNRNLYNTLFHRNS